MAIEQRKILIAIVVLTLLLFPVVTLTSGPIRIVLGLLFIILFPGYTLISALFPRTEDLNGIERLALSFGASIAIVPLIGLILNYVWEIRLYPILISISIFIIVISAISYYRQQKIPENERFHITLKASLPEWTGIGKLDKTLSLCLLIAIIIALGSLGYVLAKPEEGEKFTEFYILGPDGKAEGYPNQILLGDPFTIVAEIVNHEHQPTSYTVKVMLDDIAKTEVNFGTLAHEEKKGQIINFTPDSVKEKQRVDFYLYRNSEDSPYFADPLHLYIDVVTFSVLNMEGKPVDYIEQSNPGEPVELIIGIVNNEPQPTSYRMEIKSEDTLYKEMETGTLTYREKWQNKVSFIPQLEEANQILECWLYKANENQPYYEQPISFTAELAKPSTPTLLSPSEGSTIPGTSITFKWKPEDRAIKYMIEINTYPDWKKESTKLIKQLGNVTQYQDTGFSSNGTTYYWRLRAGNDTGWSSPSPGWKFIN